MTALRSAVVIAKRPVPGLVKTRLCPPFSAEEAATLAAASLDDTLDAVSTLSAAHRVLAFDGDPDGWLRTGWRHVVQRGDGLDERIVDAFEAVDPNGPAVLVGMDTPQVRPDLLTAFDPDRFDACLGPAADGGYWVIGFADPAMARPTVLGVPMSLDTTGEVQLRRLRAAGLRVQVLEELLDVDTVADAIAVAGLVPGSRFAHALGAMRSLRTTYPAQVG